MKNAFWIIGILLIAAGAFLFFAGSSDTDMSEGTQDPASSEQQEADFRADARARLAALEASFEANANAEGLADAVAAIKADLEASFSAAGEEAQAQWADVEASFDSLEASIRAGASDILDRFAEVSLRLSTELQ